MSSGLRCFKKETWIFFRFRKWKTLRREERIVSRIDQESRARDLVEELPGTRLLPIIGRVAKAVQARGVAIVKFPKGAQITTPARIDLAGESHRFRFHLGDETANEAPQIDAVTPALIQPARTGREVDGRRDTDRGHDRMMWWRFSHVLKSEVTAETESDERDTPITRARVLDDRSQILCRPAMIKTEEPVRLFPAAAKIPSQHVPAVLAQSRGHPSDVALIGGALQAVRQDRQSSAIRPQPAEIEEISIGKFQTFRLETGIASAVKECSHDCLGVAAAQKRRRSKSGLNNGHAIDRPILHRAEYERP